MQEILIYAALSWAFTGALSSVAVRHWAWRKGSFIPGHILFDTLYGPISGVLIIKFAREAGIWPR